MPLYDKSVRLLMRDMVSELGLQKGQVLARDQVIAWFNKRYPRIKRGTISAHLTVMSTNAPSRIHHTVRPADDLFFQLDSRHFRLYDAPTDPAPIYPGGANPISEENRIPETTSAAVPQDAEEAPEPSEFAYESDLRDFLAKNLHFLEPGLRLYQEEGITGIEFPVGGRFVDILAIDERNNLVVIELKVSRGYDRVVGQILRYMAWIQQNHAEPSQQVRGAIVAREISTDLVLACSRVSGVDLYEYQLSVKLKKVQRQA
jgi:hypothetical protein